MLHELLDQLTAGHEVVTPAELVLLRADGSKRWLEVRASNLMDDPNVRGIVLNGRDVTERRAYQDALTYEATHDRLTELPNRAQFLHILGRAEERAIGEGRSLAVLFVDIDHFKVVNDSLGHGVGDALLVAVARRLVGAVRASDPVARLGGDEFVVVCEGVDLAGAKMVAQHVLAACAAPFEIAGRELRITASVGIAFAEHANESAEVILRNADIAMYEAKSAGRACVRVFDDNARADIVRRLDTEHALHKAVERGELEGCTSSRSSASRTRRSSGRRPSCDGRIPSGGSCCPASSSRSRRIPTWRSRSVTGCCRRRSCSSRAPTRGGGHPDLSPGHQPVEPAPQPCGLACPARRARSFA